MLDALGCSSYLVEIGGELRSRGLNDAVQIYVKSHGDELGFNLVRIPDDFSGDSTEFVDPLYMRALFERGYAMARDGFPWGRDSP